MIGLVRPTKWALREFVAESNRIEGITREPDEDEVIALKALLELDRIEVADLAAYVYAIGGGPLRSRDGMNVRVGNHVPPRGGEGIVAQLKDLLEAVNANRRTPWENHVIYETLHPFMDGNGRSGRALWAWQIVTQGHYPYGLHMGFLHPAYYAALSAPRKEETP